MVQLTVSIDREGRITLPEGVLRKLGAKPKGKVRLELAEDGVILKAKTKRRSVAAEIAAMNLPVANWEQMKQEIIAGRLEYR